MVTLPVLPYTYDALAPEIDAKTMEIHHAKHHQAYVDKYNAVIKNYPDLDALPVEDVLKKLTTIAVSEQDRTAIRNHGGGVANHTLFWNLMNPANKKDEILGKRIVQTFGSLDVFKEKFSTAALSHFGSGWAWLVENEKKEFVIYSLPNQDSPLTLGHTPYLTLDVWEHAYYLTYQNRRVDYIANWWNVVKVI